ncbi:MAG: CoA-binding protein [Spirochaetota bacterium]|nr:CoA-binding protein [Spirochaetota bacterium]
MDNIKKFLNTLNHMFHPSSLAIVGASENPASFGYHFMKYVLNYGYSGRLFPITPKSEEIMGIKAYPELLQVPGDVDYVICCVNASLVKDLLTQCAKKNVKGVHLLTGRFSETGSIEAKRLEDDIAQYAKELDIRLIGPNCVGIYSPKTGIAFNHDLSGEAGTVGAIVQSGGFGGELVRYAGIRGVRFSKAVSYGNAVDLNESDFLEYFLWDDETNTIALYIEGVRDGRRFLDTLNTVSEKKPIIVLKGGIGKVGSRSVASHTASIAGGSEMWEIIYKQYNIVKASCANEFIDLITAFNYLPQITGYRVGIIGGGGGKSVLAADASEAAGLDVIPMPKYTKSYIADNDDTLANWMDNPVDFSILPGSKLTTSGLLNTMAEDPDFDLLIAIITEDNPYDEKLWTNWIINEANEYINIANKNPKPLIAIMGNPELSYKDRDTWRWKTMIEQRERLIAARIPVFPSIDRAVSSIVKMINYYRRRR